VEATEWGPMWARTLRRASSWAWEPVRVLVALATTMVLRPSGPRPRGMGGGRRRREGGGRRGGELQTKERSPAPGKGFAGVTLSPLIGGPSSPTPPPHRRLTAKT